MKIEKGEFYMTQGGAKAEIYAIDRGSKSPIHGAVYSITANTWALHAWRLSGKWIDNSESDIDLIAKWGEPKPRRLGWVRRINGDVKCCLESALSQRTDWEHAPHLDEPEIKEE